MWPEVTASNSLWPRTRVHLCRGLSLLHGCLEVRECGESPGPLQGWPWCPICPRLFRCLVRTSQAAPGGARRGGEGHGRASLCSHCWLQSQKLPEGGGLAPSRPLLWCPRAVVSQGSGPRVWPPRELPGWRDRRRILGQRLLQRGGLPVVQQRSRLRGPRGSPDGGALARRQLGQS